MYARVVYLIRVLILCLQINPPREGNTFDAFLANAKNTASQAPPAPGYPAPGSPSATTSAPAGVVTVTQTTTVGTATSSAAPAPAAPSANVHLVTVGENGALSYNPPSIQAQQGDIVSFQFRSKNHTITQSTFADPCRKLEFTSTSGQIGFDSGFMAVAANADAFPTFNITVNGTDPVWAYCRQANHCGNGMVFAINAVESGNKSFAAFQALAKQINGTGSGTASSAVPSATAAPGTGVNGASQLIAAGSWIGVVSTIFMMLL
ncbi:hypothetical protein FRC08_000890 [Ceratobasidium sp. 394]|nr:hypothetical protein FRC08_000890 [Ceratobasidium sp. 394]